MLPEVTVTAIDYNKDKNWGGPKQEIIYNYLYPRTYGFNNPYHRKYTNLKVLSDALLFNDYDPNGAKTRFELDTVPHRGGEGIDVTRNAIFGRYCGLDSLINAQHHIDTEKYVIPNKEFQPNFTEPLYKLRPIDEDKIFTPANMSQIIHLSDSLNRLPFNGSLPLYQLGVATMGFNKDDKGYYVSYGDKWDINPLSGGNSPAPDWIRRLFSSKDALGGRPIEFYNRKYLSDGAVDSLRQYYYDHKSELNTPIVYNNNGEKAVYNTNKYHSPSGLSFDSQLLLDVIYRPIR